MSSDSTSTNEPKRALFKKKLVKGNKNSRRVKLDFGDETAAPETELLPAKKIKSKHQFIRSSPAPQADISKWKVQNDMSEDSNKRLEVSDGVLIESAVEGAVFTGADLEELEPENQNTAVPKPQPRYVPKLDISIEKKLSARSVVTDIANEYDEEDDYDILKDTHATIDPEPANDLEINHDDELVDTPYNISRKDVEPDQSIYDIDIDLKEESDSENSSVIRIIQPLTASEEVNRLGQLIAGMELQHEITKNELAELQSHLPLIEEKKANLLKALNSI